MVDQEYITCSNDISVVLICLVVHRQLSSTFLPTPRDKNYSTQPRVQNTVLPGDKKNDILSRYFVPREKRDTKSK